MVECLLLAIVVMIVDANMAGVVNRYFIDSYVLSYIWRRY